jgi:ferredoxin
MNYKLHHRSILYNDAQLGPYPDHLLRRVDQITTAVPGPVRNRSQLESASSRARRGEYGAKVYEERNRVVKKIPIGAALSGIRINIRDINRTQKNPVAPEKAPLPDDPRVISRHLKSMGYFFGADLMGICEVPPGAAYRDDDAGNPIDVPYRYAVVFVKRKHQPTTLASSGRDWIFDSTSHQVYQLLAVWSDTMADYIRRLGHEAEVSNQQNYITLMTPLILAAGLGEISRLGIALNPFLGANFKASAVLTNLPLLPDKPIDFGLQEYCGRCMICADQCFVGAVSNREKELYNGYMTWLLDAKKCAIHNSLNKVGSVCGHCTRICPWNRPNSDPSDFKGWDGDIRKLIADVDARAAYLRQHRFRDEREDTHKWWFDLEEVDGRLIIPKSTSYEVLDP